MVFTSIAGAVNFPQDEVIIVPGDFSTIQAAIEAGEDGVLIIVAPGTYQENIDFRGKAITLQSTAPDDLEVVAATVIDGGGRGSVVAFRSGETAESMLSGFTLTGDSGTWTMFKEGWRSKVEAPFGGGILVRGSSPTIKNNIVTRNTMTAPQSSGGGIIIRNSSSISITDNTITGNRADEGGGIWASRHSRLRLTTPDDNIYRDNVPDALHRR